MTDDKDRRPDRGERQRRKTVEFIIAYTEEHGYPPSRREIGEAIGVGAPTAQRHLEQLAQRGFIEYRPGSPRAIKVLKRP